MNKISIFQRVASILSTLACGPSIAGIGDVSVPFELENRVRLGFGVDIDAPYIALNECIKYSNDNIRWDSAGAASTQSTVEMTDKFQSDSENTDLDFGYETLAKVNAGLFDANTSLNLKYGTDTTRNTSERVIGIFWKAHADYGSRIITDFTLKDEFSELLKSNPDEFRSRCGTHFAHQERRKSEISVGVLIEANDKSGKKLITGSLQKTIGGGVKIDGISGEAKTTITSSINNTVEFAKKFAKVTVDFYAEGGSGIEAAGKAAQAIDPGSFEKVGSLVEKTAQSFTQDNSAVDRIVFAPYTIFGAEDYKLNTEKLTTLGKWAMILTRVNAKIDAIESYEPSTSAHFNTYFSNSLSELNAAKSHLVNAITNCASTNVCDREVLEPLSDFVYLNELISRPSIDVSCQYQKLSAFEQPYEALNKDDEVLETLTINLTGVVQYPKLLDRDSFKIFRIDTNYKIFDVTEAFSGFSYSEPNADGSEKIFGSIYFDRIDVASLLSYDARTNHYTLNEQELRDDRTNILGHKYLIEANIAGDRVVTAIDNIDQASCGVFFKRSI